MDREKTKELANEARVDLVRLRHQSDAYELIVLNARITDTGLLKAFQITPRDRAAPLPSFIARWDEKENTVDLDPIEMSGTEARRFRAGAPGYSGHHTNRLASCDGRVFSVAIRTPNLGLVFDGDVAVGLTREVGLHETVRVEDSVIFKVIPAPAPAGVGAAT